MTSLTHKLFKKIDGRTIELLLTLGSGQVSVALVYHNNQEKPLILQSRMRTIPFDHGPSPDELQQNALEVLDILLSDFMKELGGMFELNDLYDSHQAIHSVQVMLSPLWVDTQIVNYEEQFEAPTVITQEILQAHIQEGGTENMIDASVVFARANQYHVHPEDIIGMETPEIELQIKRSNLSQVHRFNIESVINKHISTEKAGQITFVPSQKVTLATVSELFGAHSEYMVLHIDGEDSHVLTRNNEEGMRFDSVAYGIAELKRQLIKEGLAPDFVHAKDLLRAYFLGMLEDSFKARVEYVLSIESQVLANLAGDLVTKKVPLFIIADKNSEDFFTHHVVSYLDHVSRAVVIEPEHFEDYFSVTGEYVEPSVEICSFVTYLDILKTS